MAIFDSTFDGVIRQDLHMDGSVMTANMTQPSEKLILGRNAELRKNPGAMRDIGAGQEGGSWGRMLCSIPEVMFMKAIKDGYDMNSKDADHAQKEIFRFLKSEEGKLCLIN